MKRPEEMTLEGVLEKAFRAQMAGVETGLPATVLSYDATSQTARVKPIPKMRFPDGSTESLPALDAVPVQFPAGAGYAITWPLADGDPVWLAFSGRPFDGYLTTGSAEAEEPVKRRFSIADCVAFPTGPRAKTDVLASASSTALTFGEDAAAGARIEIDAGKVAIGTVAIDLLDLLDNLIGALQSAVVATVSGPQPLDPVTQTTLATIKALLAQIKA